MNVTRIKDLLQFTKEQGIQDLSLETLLCTTKPNSPGFDEDNDATLEVQQKKNTITTQRNSQRNSQRRKLLPSDNRDSDKDERQGNTTHDSSLNTTPNAKNDNTPPSSIKRNPLSQPA
ncbi:hypothetical protein DFH28DRAFT_1141407 [Melampsora americana]|nr:hypothetical protein DFH28DRAFT_1141407 [Melampsora americana]